MSRWTHPQCEACWVEHHSTTAPDGRIVSVHQPVLIKGAVAERCCFCGKVTIMGLYVRADPATLDLCTADHD